MTLTPHVINVAGYVKDIYRRYGTSGLRLTALTTDEIKVIEPFAVHGTEWT
jgi:hypothetical protein